MIIIFQFYSSKNRQSAVFTLLYHRMIYTRNIFAIKCKKMIAANNQPQIYYVVQGSETQNKNACIDKTFIDSQPLIAQKKAFDFLDFYYSAKNESRELETEEETNGIRSNFYLDELNEYSIQIKEKDITSNGIGLYIVVSGFIQNANQTIQKEDKFLLFTDINSTKETIKEMIKGLFREFGLFQYLNIRLQ